MVSSPRKKNLSKDHSVHVTDEKINTITHLFAAMLSVLGAVLLIVKASLSADPYRIVSFSIYGISLILLFVFSTLHHGLNVPKKISGVLRNLDYSAVFLFIAATFTPICLIAFRNPIGLSILGALWIIACVGIVLKNTVYLPKWITNTFYITMGWFGIFLAYPIFIEYPFEAFALLFTGGILYTVGFLIYILERPNPLPKIFGFHEIWHILVFFAALCHWLLIYFYI